MVAVPVLLGSLMRIPLGFLTDRHGGRLIFSALMAWTILPLLALAVWHESYPTLIALSFLLGFAGASFAVGVPFVSRWYPPAQQGYALGIYGVGMGGTVLAGLTAPAIAERGNRSAVPCPRGAARHAAAAFAIVARDAHNVGARPPNIDVGRFVLRSSASAWAMSSLLRSFGGFVAMFLYLRRL